MNVILIVMALAGRGYAPQYVVRYPTQQQCEQAMKPHNQDLGVFSVNKTQAVCVPEVRL